MFVFDRVFWPPWRTICSAPCTSNFKRSTICRFVCLNTRSNVVVMHLTVAIGRRSNADNSGISLRVLRIDVVASKALISRSNLPTRSDSAASTTSNFGLLNCLLRCSAWCGCGSIRTPRCTPQNCSMDLVNVPSWAPTSIMEMQARFLRCLLSAKGTP